MATEINGRGLKASPVAVVSALCASITAFALVGLVFWLAISSLPAFRHEGLSFLTTADWSYRHNRFGAAAMLYGTAVVSLIALVLAAPVGIGTAVFTSEICPARFRLAVKAGVELQAGVPSVVYGLLGVLVLRTWVFDGLDWLGFEPLSGDTLVTAGILLAVMVLPTIATLSDDALQSVPSAMRDAARGLGLTRAETVAHVVLPQALRGLVGAILLGFGRAIGETIAVFLVVGRADNMFPESLASLAPLVDAGQTITSKLGGAEPSIAVGSELHMSAILTLGFILMMAVMSMTFVADLLRSKFRSEV